jgi:hypothetical protein
MHHFHDPPHNDTPCSRREPKDVEEGAEGGGTGRDVFNEKPSLEDIMAADEGPGHAAVLPRGVTIHTNRVCILVDVCVNLHYHKHFQLRPTSYSWQLL